MDRPKEMARVAGFLYLIIIVCGIFAEVFVRGNLIVYGDATVTANNIIASESLFRIGFASGLIMLVCDIVVTLILYVLFRLVNKNLALLATFFRLVSIAILGINLLNHFAALLLLGNAQFLTVFETDQLHALALLSLRLHSYGYDISLMFFGFHLLFLGYLIYKSEYLPKIIGILLVIACLCYLTNSFTRFLAPAYAVMIFPGILVPAFIAELSLSLGLLLKSVKISEIES